MNIFQKLQLGQDLLNAKLNNAGVRALPNFYSVILDKWVSLNGRRSAPPDKRGHAVRTHFFNKNILDPSTGLPLVNHQIEKAITCITAVSYSVVPGLLPDVAVHELLGGRIS